METVHVSMTTKTRRTVKPLRATTTSLERSHTVLFFVSTRLFLVSWTCTSIAVAPQQRLRMQALTLVKVVSDTLSPQINKEEEERKQSCSFSPARRNPGLRT